MPLCCFLLYLCAAFVTSVARLSYVCHLWANGHRGWDAPESDKKRMAKFLQSSFAGNPKARLLMDSAELLGLGTRERPWLSIGARDRSVLH